VFPLWSVHGLYSSGIYGTVAVTSEYSGRAAVSEKIAELQANGSCDAILEDRQPVKIQCEDSASVVVNCKEL
jgi:hypothetical protein